MKEMISRLLLSIAILWPTPSLFAAESPLQESITLKWLGTAGWEIQVDGAVVLIDPFLTRKERSDNAEWKTNEEEVLNDEWGTPFSEGIPEANRRRAQRFAKIIKSVDNEIKVVIPQFFTPILLQ